MRIENKSLLETYRKMPCAIISRDHAGAVAGHHIKHRATGGDDISKNVLPLCAAHHTGMKGIHGLGTKTFLRKYKDNLSRLNQIKIKDYLDAIGDPLIEITPIQEYQ